MRVIHRGVRDQLKALRTETAFRNAQHNPLTMVFDSEFVKENYALISRQRGLPWLRIRESILNYSVAVRVLHK